MTPKDRDDLNALLQRLAQMSTLPRDPESDRVVIDALSRAPNLPLVMAQALMAQQEALVDAQRRLADAQAQASRAAAAPPPFPGPTASPPPNPWGAGAPAYPAQPGYPPPPAYAQQPSYASPPPPAYAQPRSFMRGMFETMAGVAGGVMAADALESMFRGGHGGGFGGAPLGGAGPWGGGNETVVNETIVNNNTTVNDTSVDDRRYYGQDQNDAGLSQADYTPDDDSGGYDDDTTAV